MVTSRTRQTDLSVGVTAVSNLGSSPITSEAVAAANEEGRRDAIFTYLFLRALARRGQICDPFLLPRRLWREFSAGLRLLRWELAGIRDHLGVQLPDARTVLREALRRAAGATAPGTDQDNHFPPLAREVVLIHFERLAWAGRRELNAEVVIDIRDKNKVIEVMARFLWNRRHASSTHTGSSTS